LISESGKFSFTRERRREINCGIMRPVKLLGDDSQC
jgi:hypothetical protein